MRKLISDEGLVRVADTLDRITNIDIPARGSIQVLYQAARALQSSPVSLAAVRLLEQRVKPGDFVMIATGWAEQPHNIPNKSETDGPAGAAAIARTVRMALGGLPIIVTDDYLVENMKIVMSACGCHIVEPECLANSLSGDLGFTCVPTIAVVGVPVEEQQGHQRCTELLERYSPAVCLSIERGGMNRQGCIHGMGGYDFSYNMAKLDYLFTEAHARGIATIGIGDGGNEIGMANIEQVVRKNVPNGDVCKCPCYSGIAAGMAHVDLLMTATISNWGGYALSLLLGLSQGNLEAMDNEEIEHRVLNSYLRAEFHDSMNSCVAPSADGCEEDIHLALLRLMRKTVDMGIRRYPPET